MFIIVIWYFYTLGVMIPRINPFTVCYHTKLLHCYWLNSLCCALYLHNPFILDLEAWTLLNPFTISPVPPGTPYSCNQEFVSSMSLFVFCFKDSTWNHMYLSSVRLISFSIIPCRSTCVVTSGKISFFFMVNIPLCVHTRVYL